MRLTGEQIDALTKLHQRGATHIDISFVNKTGGDDAYRLYYHAADGEPAFRMLHSDGKITGDYR